MASKILVSEEPIWSFLMVQPAALKAAAYIRLSDPGKQERGYSKQFQERKIREKCSEEDWTIRDDHVFYDGFRSTYWREREALQAMLAEARRHSFDVLLLYDLDRLSREPKHQTAILEELEYLGIKVEILNADQNHVNDGTFEGEVLTSIHGIVSSQEHRKRIKRTHDGVMERVEENGCIMPSHKPLYGYRWDDPGYKKKEKYIVYEPEAEIVRKIFNWKCHGISIHEICHRLNADHTPTPKGGTVWKPQVILDMLRHPFYKGAGFAHRYQHTYIPGRKTMKQVLRPESEWIALPSGTVPEIVTQEQWDEVQRQLQWNKEQSARRNKHPEAALCRAGVAKCGICGSNMAYRRKYNHIRGGNDQYRCMRQLAIGNTCDNSVISVKTVDDAVWKKCLELLANPKVLAEALREQYTEDPNKPSRESLERGILARGRKIQNLMEELADEGDREVKKLIRLRMKDLAEEKTGLEEELDIVKRSTMRWDDAQNALVGFSRWCETIHARIAEGEEISYREKRNAVDRLGLKIICYKFDTTPRYMITCNPPEIMQHLDSSLCKHGYDNVVSMIPLLTWVY